MSENAAGGRRLKLIQKLGYGVGDFGSNYCWTFVSSFVLLYYTNIVGLNSAVIGSLMLVSRCLDGVTDVLMGTIIDRTHSKMGKARFWFFWSAFPVAIFTFLLFNVPSGFGDTAKYAYIFIVYTLLGAVFYTMSNIAYTTMSALVTKDTKERVQLTSYRYIFATCAALAISYTTSNLVAAFGGGQAGWRMVSLLYAVICCIALLIPVASVRELPPEELDDGSVKTEEEKLPFLQTFVLLIKNKYFLYSLGYYIIFYFAAGVYSGLGIYYCTYSLGNANFLGTLSLAGMLPSLIIYPFVPKLAEKVGVKNAAMYGMIVAAIGAFLALGGGLKLFIPIILIGMVIRQVGCAPMIGSFNALLAEVDDYSYLKFGKRVTGSIYSCVSMGIKVGTGFGTAFVGYLLQWVHYDASLEVQSAFTQSAITWAYFLPYAIFAVAAVIILLIFDVEKQNKKLSESKSSNQTV